MVLCIFPPKQICLRQTRIEKTNNLDQLPLLAKFGNEPVDCAHNAPDKPGVLIHPACRELFRYIAYDVRGWLVSP